MTVLALGGTGFYINTVTPEYTARITVAPLGGTQQGGLNRTSPFGGRFRSLFGSFQEATEFDKLRVVISSIPLAEKLQKEYGLLQIIYASSWDADTGRWLPPQDGGWYSRAERFVKSALHMPGWRPPDASSLANFLRRIRAAQVGGPVLWEFSLTHRDPKLAAYLLDLTFREADAILRQRKIDQLRAQIQYVRERLQEVIVIEHRVALANILGDTERQLMASLADLPVASETVKPVSVGATPSWPRPRLMLVGSVMLGLLLGVLVTLAVEFFLRRRRNGWG